VRGGENYDDFIIEWYFILGGKENKYNVN